MGPASDGTTDHHSSIEEAFIGVRISRTAVSVNPAPANNSLSAPGASSENGPVGTLLALAGYYFAVGDLPRAARVLIASRAGMTAEREYFRPAI
ncbi:MAG: hypothetical protein QOE74_3529, partial [Mycobacterium sp.]|nr:hypothetical protein [Mycobacterium sp.]